MHALLFKGSILGYTPASAINPLRYLDVGLLACSLEQNAEALLSCSAAAVLMSLDVVGRIARKYWQATREHGV